MLHLLRDGAYTLLFSDSLLAELVDVLRRPRLRDKYSLDEEVIAAVLQLILLRGENVVPGEPVVACRDAKDNKILEAALAGQADVIVSGDDDLLILDPFEGILIVGAKEFLERLAG